MVAKKNDAGDRPETSKTASRQPISDVRSGGGKEGPPSSLKTGEGSLSGASAGGNGAGVNYDKAKGQNYDVQAHTDEKGLEVIRVSAESGDEASQKVLAQKGYKGVSIRGVAPASDPDPNSLGGERDASIMIENAENFGDAGINPMGTEENRLATEKLGKADIKELGE